MKLLKIIVASALTLALLFTLVAATPKSKDKKDNFVFVSLDNSHIDYIKDLKPNQYRIEKINGKRVLITRRRYIE